MSSATVTPISDKVGEKEVKAADEVRARRAAYGVQKHRASDLAVGDVTRNGSGKWDVVVSTAPCADGLYVYVTYEANRSGVQLRNVHLVDVQIVKNS